MTYQPLTWEEQAAVAFASFGAVAIQLRRSHAIKIVGAISGTMNMIKFLLLHVSVFYLTGTLIFQCLHSRRYLILLRLG